MTPRTAPPIAVRRRGLTVLIALVITLSAGLVALARSAGAATNHSPIGAVTIQFTDGAIRYSGWAIDPDYLGPLVVQLTLNNHVAGQTVASLPQPGLSARYPQYTDNHGFSGYRVVPNGGYVACVRALNRGLGLTRNLGCVHLGANNNPVGAVTGLQLTPGGVLLTGWALDPNTPRPIPVTISVDGKPATTATAGLDTTSVPARNQHTYGTKHGFATTLTLPQGAHTLCATAINFGVGAANTALGCKAITALHSPIGTIAWPTRATPSTTALTFAGYALDPDTNSPILVKITVDGTPITQGAARFDSAAANAAYPLFTGGHGYSIVGQVDTREHTVCAVAVNAGTGSDTSLGCQLYQSTGATSPAPVTGLAAMPGDHYASLTWASPVAAGGAVTQYQVMIPRRPLITVAGSALTAQIGSLANGTRYSMQVRAYNQVGWGSWSAPVTVVPTPIPPQVTPAPVSTSHYIRNINGTSSDVPKMRAMGAADANANPSGHRYLVLLQIGGQDMSRGGVLLSATSNYVSDAGVVAAMKAYLDGYVTRQRANAPLTLAIGTNNDVDVSAASGRAWADLVVDPVAAYAARYPGVSVAGANDIEPGFSATVSESRSWLSGYLAATNARFVFNGSADGCRTTNTNSACNNGWSMAALQWLSGGAAPTRISSLPQIYNTAMPLQWKFISLTGVAQGKPRISFNGPLTEYTACSQAGSCGSLSNVVAWQQLWAALSSNASTRLSQMPNGTDLKIN